MQAAQFRIGGRNREVSRKNILAGIKQSTPGTGTRYCLCYGEEFYSPKEVVRQGVGLGKGFAGGNETNKPLKDLGFLIVRKGDRPKVAKKQKQRKGLGFDKPVPAVRKLLKNLFTQKWAPLTRNFRQRDQGKFPGIYLLAYSNSKMAGKAVNERDVFYVGMSHAALFERLNQFLSSAEGGPGHSAGKRFYREGKKYGPGKFYVALIPIPCETEKDYRRAIDLQKMGRIAELEYAAMAKIKQETEFEPLLNKK